MLLEYIYTDHINFTKKEILQNNSEVMKQEIDIYFELAKLSIEYELMDL